MKRTLKVSVAALLAAAALAALVWSFIGGRKERTAEAQREAPVSGPSRVSSENGLAVLTFDESAQRQNGIRTAILKLVAHQTELPALGVILQLQSLIDLRTSYSTATAQMRKAEAAANASKTEYERLRGLNLNGKSASDKAVEAARAQWESDQATLHNAEDSLSLQKSGVLQHWGKTVAEWLFDDSPEFNRLLTQNEVLIQVTLPVGAAGTPETVLLDSPDGKLIPARFVSPLPQLDPRLQGRSLLYTTVTRPGLGLIPGLSVSVHLPEGPFRRGVVIPYSAIVWLQGQPWCYVEQQTGRFVRREVPASNPRPEGFFVLAGFSAGSRIVTTGAQTLLSEEFRSQIQVLGDEDKQ
jgi:hypothetical protein